MAQSWWIGFVAVIAGWVVTESGRQPWIVQGIMRTADATSPVLGATHRASRWCCSSSPTAIVFSFGIYYINRLIAKGLDSRREARRAPRSDLGRARRRPPAGSTEG